MTQQRDTIASGRIAHTGQTGESHGESLSSGPDHHDPVLERLLARMERVAREQTFQICVIVVTSAAVTVLMLSSLLFALAHH